MTAKPYTSQPLPPALLEMLQRPRPGQKIRVTQTIRVGSKTWTTTVAGTFRELGSLATGLATHRLPQDDIVIAVVHFTKENGEHSSVAVDENTHIEVVS